MDKLDKEREGYMVIAEKYAGRPRVQGIYAWSPMLEKVGQTITYWKLRLTQVRDGHVNMERVKRLETQLKIKHIHLTSKTAVKTQLDQAWKELKKVQQSAVQRREEHLEQLAEFYAEKRNSNRVREIHRLMHIERVRLMANKHRWLFKKNYGMIRSLLVHDFVVEKMNPIFASLTLLAYLGSIFTRH